MSNSVSYNDLYQSYGRCLHNGRLIGRFYEIFLESHLEIPAAFTKTDFDRQRRLLRRILTNSIMYAAGIAVAVIDGLDSDLYRNYENNNYLFAPFASLRTPCYLQRPLVSACLYGRYNNKHPVSCTSAIHSGAR